MAMLRIVTPARARLGVSLMFFTNGVIFSGLLPRYPEVKDAFRLSDTAYGLLVITVPLGSILAAGVAAPIIRRFGARVVMGAGSVFLAFVMALVGASPVVMLFAAALFAYGVVDTIVDAAQNVQGVIVEQWRGRSIINSLHAVWSLGAATGGVIGTWCAANGIPLSVQLGVNSAVWAIAAVAASVLARTPYDRRAVEAAPGVAETTPVVAEAAPIVAEAAPGAVETGPGARAEADIEPATSVRIPARPWLLLAPWIVVAVCGTLVEEFSGSWSVLFLGRETSAPAGLAGIAFTTMLASQFVGRLLGDLMVDRWGREAVARTGSLLIAGGGVAVMVAPDYLVALVGMAFMGFGCATLVPAAFAAAARIPGLPHGTGIAYVGWLMRLGFLVTSPVIGVISDHAGLRTAILVPIGAGLLGAAITHRAARARVAPTAASAVA